MGAGILGRPERRCQSLNEDDMPCGRPATKLVKGLPGYHWWGYHCDEHADRGSKLFDHQGGCVVVDLNEGGDGG